MSLIFTNTPSEFQPVLSDGIYFTVSADTYNPLTTFKFRYVYDLFVDDVVVFQGKCAPNPFGLGIIDLQQILETYTNSLPISYWDTTPIYTHQTIAFSIPANEQVINYQIKCGYEYSYSEILPITGFTGVGDTVGPPSYPSEVYKVFRSTMGTNGRATQSDFDIDPYVLSGTPVGVNPTTSGLFLTNAPRYLDIADNEYFTLGFTNYYLWSGVTSGLSEGYYVKYNFYDDQGGLITGYTYDNITTNGGGPRTNCNHVYQQYYLIDPVSATTDYNLMYVGAGPENIPNFPSGSTQYTVQLFGKFTGSTSPFIPTPTPTSTPLPTLTPTPSPTPLPCSGCTEYQIYWTGESLATVTIVNCFTQTSQDVIVQPNLYYSVCSCEYPVFELDIQVITGGPCFAPTPSPTPTPTRTPTPTCMFKTWVVNLCESTCSGGICTCSSSGTQTVYTNCSVTDITDPSTEIFENTGLTNPFTADFSRDGSIWNSTGSGVTLVCVIGGPC